MDRVVLFVRSGHEMLDHGGLLTNFVSIDRGRGGPPGCHDDARVIGSALAACVAETSTRARAAGDPKSNLPSLPLLIDDLDAAELTWQQRLGKWVLSRAAAAYIISLLVHLLLLIHVPRWQSNETNTVTTVVQGDDLLVQPFDELQDVELPVIGGQQDEANPQQYLAENSDRELNLLEHKFLADVTAADTQGEDAGSGIGAGGFRFLEPKNAVRVGSFTAWTIPIAQRFGEKPEAGDAPRPGQSYHIVIQVRMPDGRSNYSINDLSGKVTGTDSYVQLIPAGAWVPDEHTQALVRVRLGRRLPVVDGVVQILIRVPGADAQVKDTITVKSRILKEEQTLELVFEGRGLF